MKTLAFCAVFGVIPGYNHVNLHVVVDNGLESLHSFNKTNIQVVSEAWQAAMQKEFEKTDIVVSAVMTESNTVYPVGFGCPPGGEKTVTVNGHFNPKFIKLKPGFSEASSKKIAFGYYRRAVVRVCEAVRKELKQTTVSVAFYELGDFVYLVDKNKE
jgi:hypothetical protein